MLKKISILWIILSLLTPIPGFSGTLQQLAVKFGKDIKDTDNKIAVMDFSSAEAGKSQDSNVVRERITTFLAQNKNITLIERSLLEKVFQEQKIQVSGAVGADTAKKIGELTGATAIVSGTLSELANDEVELNARIIEVGTGKVISAGQAVFKKDWKYFAPPALLNEGKVVADSAQDYYKRGVQYHNDGKYNMALEFYSKAIKLKPDFLEAYYGRGTIYALMSSPADEYLGIKSKYDEALADFTRAIDLKIDYTEAYFSRAMVYRAKAQYSSAISDLAKAMELTPVTTMTAVACYGSFMEVPDSPDYIGNYLLRGSVYESKGTPSDLWSAIEDYNKVIAKFPDCGYLYTLRAKVYKTFPNYPKAIADYSRAIELSTSTTANYIARADALYAKGDYASAITDYTRAIDLRTAQRNIVVPPSEIPRWEDTKPIDPAFSARYVQDADVYINRGNAYHMKADYDKAIADYNKAIELSAPVDDLGPSGSPVAYANRGGTYLAKGEKEKAISDYTKAIELSPSYSSAYMSRGEIYRDNKETDKAFADYTKVIELDPQNSDAYLSRGHIYGDRNEKDKAALDYDRAIELNPKNAEAHFYRGQLYHNEGNTDKALEEYTRTIELVPGLSYAYYNRGQVLMSLKEDLKAISDYSKAIELSPKDMDAYYSRGIAYTHLKDYKKAIEDFDKYLVAHPDDSFTYDMRIGNYLSLGEYNKVIADCTAVITKSPKKQIALFAYKNRARAYLHNGEYNKAIRDADAIFAGEYLDKLGGRTSGFAADIYEMRGEASARKKDYAKAISDCTRTIEIEPEYPAAYRWRAEAYYGIGEYKKSSDDVAKALELFPGFQIKMQKLIDSLRATGY